MREGVVYPLARQVVGDDDDIRLCSLVSAGLGHLVLAVGIVRLVCLIDLGLPAGHGVTSAAPVCGATTVGAVIGVGAGVAVSMPVCSRVLS